MDSKEIEQFEDIVRRNSFGIELSFLMKAVEERGKEAHADYLNSEEHKGFVGYKVFPTKQPTVYTFTKKYPFL